MTKVFDSFTFARFTFIIRAETRMQLPVYKGSTLRGGFGHALRRIVCSQRGRECRDCILRKQCVYGYIFETSPPEDSKMLENFSDVPRPFIIEPPLDGKTEYEPDDEMSFGLTLMGRAIEFLPYFVLAFENLGKELGIGRGRGKFSLQKVISGNREIYQGDSGMLLGEPDVTRASDLTLAPALYNNHIRLDFLTPLRIKSDGKLTNKPEFHILIHRLLERASRLAYFHCGLSLDIDEEPLIEAAANIAIESEALRWYDWQRYSARWQSKMMMGGVVGKVTYSGDLERFIPLLLLGEQIHVGKGAVFGLGKYLLLPQKTAS